MKKTLFLFAGLFCILILLGYALYAQDARTKRKLKKNPEQTQNSPITYANVKLNFFGKVLDQQTGEPLIGVTLKVKELNIGTQTDLDGNFTISNLDSNSPYTVEVNYISYQSKELSNLVLKPGENKPYLIMLEEVGVNVEEVVIKGDIRKESDAAAQNLQKLNIKLIDVFSADMILQSSSDLFMASAINRMPGIALIEDKFLTVRGLPERYNGILFNGFPLPVMNVERQTFDFNHFFSPFIAQTQLIKTASPDQTGNLGGGIVRFETQAIPSQNLFNISLISAYNSFASFKTSYLPQSQTQGLLGFFPKYSPLYDENNFPPINSPLLQQNANQFQGDFMTRSITASPNLYLQTQFKRRIQLGEKNVLGVVTGLNLNNIYQKEQLQLNVLSDYSEPLGYNLVADFSNSEIWKNLQIVSAMANAGFQSERLNIQFKNTFLTTHQARISDMLGDYFYQTTLFTTPYRRLIRRTENQLLLASQLQTEWLALKKDKHELKLSFSIFNHYAKTFNPFYATINFEKNNENNSWYLSDNVDIGSQNTLLFMNMQSLQKDNMMGTEVFAQFYNNANASIRWNAKLGIYTQIANKSFNARQLGFLPLGLDTTQLKELSLQNMQFAFPQDKIQNNSIELLETTDDKDNFTSQFLNFAPYFLSEVFLNKKWSFMLGARFDMQKESIQNKNIAGSVVSIRDTLLINPLPSIALVRHLNDKTNLKLGLSKTIIRADARELSVFSFFDRQTLSQWQGNPQLLPTKIYNIDLRGEYFPQGTDMITTTLFFKYLDDPIEQTVLPQGGTGDVFYNLYTLNNAEAAISYGMETEFRKRLSYEPTNYLSNLSIYGNITVLQSRVIKEYALLGSESRTNRRLQGLSPLLINTGILFKEPKTKIGLELFYNRFGRQIVVVGKPGVFNDLVVLPRDRIDFQISKTFKDKITLRFIAQDLLNQYFYRVQFKNNNINDKFVNARLNTQFRQGRLFTFSITYQLQ